MKPDHLVLPSGTSAAICASRLFIGLKWRGYAGLHAVHLEQGLDGLEGVEREEAIAKAVELFRNVVGLDVIDDAMNAGPTPGVPTVMDPPEDWRSPRGL